MLTLRARQFSKSEGKVQEMRRRAAKLLKESSRTIDGEQQDNRWRAVEQLMESTGKRKKIKEKSQKKQEKQCLKGKFCITLYVI